MKESDTLKRAARILDRYGDDARFVAQGIHSVLRRNNRLSLRGRQRIAMAARAKWRNHRRRKHKVIEIGKRVA